MDGWDLGMLWLSLSLGQHYLGKLSLTGANGPRALLGTSEKKPEWLEEQHTQRAAATRALTFQQNHVSEFISRFPFKKKEKEKIKNEVCATIL